MCVRHCVPVPSQRWSSRRRDGVLLRAAADSKARRAEARAGGVPPVGHRGPGSDGGAPWRRHRRGGRGYGHGHVAYRAAGDHGGRTLPASTD